MSKQTHLVKTLVVFTALAAIPSGVLAYRLGFGQRVIQVRPASIAEGVQTGRNMPGLALISPAVADAATVPVLSPSTSSIPAAPKKAARTSSSRNTKAVRLISLSGATQFSASVDSMRTQLAILQQKVADRIAKTNSAGKVIYVGGGGGSPAPAPTPTPTPTSTTTTTTPISTPTTTDPAPVPAPTSTATTTNPTPTSTPATDPITTPIASTSTASTPSTTTGHFWGIRSVSSMKLTKDAVCGQPTLDYINKWIDKAVGLGVNYIAVETPYDDPSCASAVAYTKEWVDAIHARGLNVWHRHMPLAFEGIYSVAKDANKDYISQISNYIKAHPDFFKTGDIFTPIPEPQNGGIQGITYCAQNVCVFKSAADFNSWLRNAMSASQSAFSSVGLGGQMKVGYFGFDGFVAWGSNNPDWHGILEDATVQQMGNITIDHYPELISSTMRIGLDELQAKYPNTPIVIGEWGTVAGGDTVADVSQTMAAAMRPNVVGFDYWHMGMGGNEALLNDDFSERPAYAAVRSYYAK